MLFLSIISTAYHLLSGCRAVRLLLHWSMIDWIWHFRGKTYSDLLHILRGVRVTPSDSTTVIYTPDISNVYMCVFCEFQCWRSVNGMMLTSVGGWTCVFSAAGVTGCALSVRLSVYGRQFTLYGRLLSMCGRVLLPTAHLRSVFLTGTLWNHFRHVSALRFWLTVYPGNLAVYRDIGEFVCQIQSLTILCRHYHHHYHHHLFVQKCNIRIT